MPEISQKYAKHLEFRGEFQLALTMYEKGLIGDARSDNDILCNAVRACVRACMHCLCARAWPPIDPWVIVQKHTFVLVHACRWQAWMGGARSKHARTHERMRTRCNEQRFGWGGVALGRRGRRDERCRSLPRPVGNP